MPGIVGVGTAVAAAVGVTAVGVTAGIIGAAAIGIAGVTIASGVQNIIGGGGQAPPPQKAIPTEAKVQEQKNPNAQLALALKKKSGKVKASATNPTGPGGLDLLSSGNLAQPAGLISPIQPGTGAVGGL